MNGVSRRQLIFGGAGLAGLGLLAGCGLLPASLMPGTRAARIGYLSPISASAPQIEIFLAAFRRGMNELGYAEGRQFTLEQRFAEGNPARLPDLAAELIQLPVDVILAGGTPAVLAAKQASQTVPIVIPLASDPVGSGIAVSLSHPGGNVTGLMNVAPQLGPKRLQLLMDVRPGRSHVAVLWNGDVALSRSEWQQTQAAAQQLGLQFDSLEVRAASGRLGAALAALSTSPADALVVISDPVLDSQATSIVAQASSSRLPTIYNPRLYVDVDGLMAYGPDFADLYRRAATYVDKILKGARTADLPIEQPTRFDFVVNLKTAQALGLTIPPSVLQQATEVIQ